LREDCILQTHVHVRLNEFTHARTSSVRGSRTYEPIEMS